MTAFASANNVYKKAPSPREAHFGRYSLPLLVVSDIVFMVQSPHPSLLPCWFGINRPHEKEHVPRDGSFDLTTTNCCEKRSSLSDALNQFKGKPSLYEFNSPLEVILYRANGELIFDEGEALSREICANHFNSLLSQWGKSKHLHTTKRGSGKSYVCSLPKSYHSGARPKGVYTMNKTQSIKWMDSFGELIHPGIVLCLDHKKLLYCESSGKVVQNYEDELNDMYTEEEEIVETLEKNDDLCESPNNSILLLLASICGLLGINRLLCNREWNDLEEGSRMKKKRAFRALVLGIAKAIAGDNFGDLMEFTSKDCSCPKNSGDDLLNAISAKYAASTNRKDKMELLSLVLSVKSYCQRKISDMMSVSKHQMRTAVAYSKGLYSIIKYKRVRYNLESVREFIYFLARSSLIASMPYGDSEAVLSDGSKVNVASMCRLYSYSRIIREYHSYLKKTGKYVTHFLGRTSLFLILKKIAKSKNKQLFCVDEFLGDAQSAFDNIDSCLSKLSDMDQISSDELTLYKQGLRVTKSFLETGYRSHIQQSSEIGSHCSVHALSDANDNNFSSKCNHSHDYLCLQCEQVDSVLHTILEKARDIGEYAFSSNHPQNVEIGRMFEVIELAVKSIFKFRKHLLRSAASDTVRREIQESLQDSECLLTIDYAMKLLASSSLEKQSGFYAKKGVPLHIGHALVRFGECLYHHVFAHLIRDGEQDCDSVTAILRHTFSELERLGVTKITLRSDNAVTFKSASVISMLQSLARSTPLILRYAFSETQDGKGPCDRAAAYLKRPIISWNESKKDSVTPQQMFDAMTESPPKGCSIFLVDIKSSPNRIKANSIPGISSFFDFEFTLNGLLVRKYAGIGNGKFIPSNKLVPNISSLSVIAEGGFLEKADSWVLLRTDRNDAVVSDEDEFDLQDGTYKCSVKNCLKSFSSIDELEKHEFEQSHEFESVKETMLDTAINTFSKVVETEECAKSSVDQSDIIKKRCDIPTQSQGWAIKDGRAPRMDETVQAIAEKFFLEKRAEGKRASPSECCEMLRTMKDEKTGYFRFTLAVCPSEKSLTSTFGSWENKRLRPKLSAIKGRGRPRKNSTATPRTGAACRKRGIVEVEESSDDVLHDNVVNGDEECEEEEETILDKIDDEEIMMSMVNEVFDEIFYS